MDYKRIIKFAAIGISAVIGLSITVAFIHSLFYISLETPEPSFLLVDRKFKFLAELGNQENNYGYWPLPDSLPTRLVAMTLAAEDRRFYSHPGIDLRAIARALHQNYISRESYSGASTIAMQVARLQTPASRGWYSKLRESYTALWLTLRFGREKILRQYLTIAPYGNRIAGANYASRRYFQKPLVDLSWAEAALLAAVPKAPGKMNLFKSAGVQAAKKRAKLILDRALQYKWISAEQRQQASDELARLVLPVKEWREYEALHAVLAIENYLCEKANRRHIVLNPLNPTLQTSFDLDLQQAVQSILTERISALRNFRRHHAPPAVCSSRSSSAWAWNGSAIQRQPCSPTSVWILAKATMPLFREITIRNFWARCSIKPHWPIAGTFRPFRFSRILASIISINISPSLALRRMMAKPTITALASPLAVCTRAYDSSAKPIWCWRMKASERR
jgi:membrane peptidoglycan carboxypeptidase